MYLRYITLIFVNILQKVLSLHLSNELKYCHYDWFGFIYKEAFYARQKY